MPRPTAGLSEYELERLDTIARNEAFLKSLGIDQDKKELVKPKERLLKSFDDRLWH